MVYSLMFSLPGTPVLFYGEEIGMEEDLAEASRLAVRTPMQWTAGRNGGFSPAALSKLTRPVVAGGFSPEFVNVLDQRRDPESLLSFMKLLIRRYRESPELGWGTPEVLGQPNPEVLAHLSSWDDGAPVALRNLGPEPRRVPLVLADYDSSHRLDDRLVSGSTPLADDGSSSWRWRATGTAGGGWSPRTAAACSDSAVTEEHGR